MGTWGTGVLENDNSRDVYDAYLRLFDSGQAGSAILRKLKRDHLYGGDGQDRSEFWPAIALASWECGQL